MKTLCEFRFYIIIQNARAANAIRQIKQLIKKNSVRLLLNISIVMDATQCSSIFQFYGQAA